MYEKWVFPSDQALLKALYLATFEATKKWTQPLSNCIRRIVHYVRRPIT